MYNWPNSDCSLSWSHIVDNDYISKVIACSQLQELPVEVVLVVEVDGWGGGGGGGRAMFYSCV